MSPVLSMIALLCVVLMAGCGAKPACPLYLAPSKVKGGGKGIFVGTRVKVGKGVGHSEGLIIDDYLVQDLQLMDYVFESHYDLHSAVFFGAALMLNHAPAKQASVAKKWSRGVVPSLDSVSLRPFTNYLGVSFEAQFTLKPGTEVTFTYGNEAYFDERNFPFNFVDKDTVAPSTKGPVYTVEELEEVGHCLADIYVNKSTIPMAGKGVFSKQTHSIGDSVSVSPVLVVPKHVVEKIGRSSVLMNFCFSDDGTDLALLPLGTAALINHGASPNVAVRWYYWESDERQGESRTAQEVLSGNLTTLLRSAAAPLYFEYYALRPIEEGEELVMNYGSQWEDAWGQYVEAMTAWSEVYGGQGNMQTAPQFRHTVGIPEGMFPESVYKVSCFGTRDCDEYFSIRQPKVLHRKLNNANFTGHLFDLQNVNHAKKTFQTKLLQTSRTEVSVDGGAAVLGAGVKGETSMSSPLPRPEDSLCQLYLAPSISNRGRLGVFGGVPFQRGDVLDISPAILISTQVLSALRHIGAPAMRDHYFTVLYGPGAAVKATAVANIDRTYDAKDRLRSVPSPQAQSLRPYNIHTNMLYYASDTIEEGEELKVSSGERVTETQVQAAQDARRADKYSIKELEAVGHCLSDIYVNQSTIPMAGNGVFSKQAYKSGSTVSISPASVVPRHLLEDEASSVLLNYCLSDDDIDLCVLPLGLPAIFNHDTDPNIALRWWHNPSFKWTATDLLSGQLESLLQGSLGPLYLEYYAVRPIAVDEELTISYGSSWEEAWTQYMSLLSSWIEDTSNSDSSGNSSKREKSMMDAPQFRHHITISSGLFPPAVYKHTPCLGNLGCSGPTKLQRPFRIEYNLNKEVHSRNLFQSVQNLVDGKQKGKADKGDINSDATATSMENNSVWTTIYKMFFSL